MKATGSREEIEDQNGGAAGLIQDVKRIEGIKFKLFDDPSNVVKMLMGQPVDLFTYDMPEIGASYAQELSVQLKPFPIVLKAGGSIGISADLAFGYDTFGLQQWADADYAANQVGNVFNGFYIDDEIQPEDEAEFNLSLGIGLGGGIGVSSKGEVTAELWGGPYGELTGNLGFDLNDPNNDGKFRGMELVSQLSQGILPVRLSGASVEAKLGAKLEASLGVGSIGGSITLVDYTFLEHTIYEYEAGDANNQLFNLPDQGKRISNPIDTSASGFSKNIK